MNHTLSSRLLVICTITLLAGLAITGLVESTAIDGDPAAVEAVIPTEPGDPVVHPTTGELMPPFLSPFKDKAADDEILVAFRDIETSPYHPTYRHRGIDLVNPAFDEADPAKVYAAYDGVLGIESSCALYIEHWLPDDYDQILPELKVRTYYAHISRTAPAGDVKRGDEIGVVYESGSCVQGEVHIHISVSPQQRPETAGIDPSNYFGAEFNYDKGARGQAPSNNNQPFDYLDTIGFRNLTQLTFESGLEVNAWETLYPSIDAPPIGTILTGTIDGRSGQVTGRAGQPENDGLAFYQGVFLANQRYTILMDVNVLNADGANPYFKVVSRSGSCPSQSFDIPSATTNSVQKLEFDVQLADCHDYGLVFGERNIGTYQVDNIQILKDGVLFKDSFLNKTDWTFYDSPLATQSGPSNWDIAVQYLDLVLKQTTNIYSDGDTYEGTYAIAGEDWWTDYHYKVEILPSDNDGIYVLFRYVDRDNHYRFYMDRQQSLQRLEKKVAGTYTTLSENTAVGYNNGWNHVEVVLDGDSIRVYNEYELALEATDSTFAAGKIGVGGWASTGLMFDNVLVTRSAIDPFADAVEIQNVKAAAQGNGHANPNEVLGRPNYFYTNGAYDYLSIGGPGYSVIYDMGEGEEIIDGPGYDLRIVEIGAALGGVSENFEVSVSESISGPWAYLGIAYSSSAFDLSKVGLPKVRYVWLSDLSSATSNPFPGSDIDAIVALNMVGNPLPAKPTNITQENDGSDVVLSWQGAPSHISYNIYASPESNNLNMVKIGTVSAVDTPADFLGALPITTYTFRHGGAAGDGYAYAITAVDESGWESNLASPAGWTIMLPFVTR